MFDGIRRRHRLKRPAFGPCHRCRPHTSPGTPAWLGTSAVVSRALRLIHEGALDAGKVEQLAGRVGLGSRHLRR
jgi:methylphosphotriester-DNA--protein-cysteine methyltransferase